MPDEPNLQQQEPEPQVAEVAPHAPALIPLMQRVKAAQDANDINELRRLRWCFHEAAHAIVAHYYKATVERIVVNPANGGRPYASIDKQLLKNLADAVAAHGGGSPQALDAVLPFFAQYVSGELLEQEAQVVQPILSERIKIVGWDKYIADPTQFDIDMIIAMGRGAGFKHRIDLVQAAEAKAIEIITGRRAAFEALVLHLLDKGSTQDQPLQAILNM